MSRQILISTHALERAGRLRDAFRSHGYEVELVTPSESLAGDGEEELLVLSEGAGEESAEGLVRQARDELGIPVIGYGPLDGGPTSTADVAEIFTPDVEAEEVALVGRTLVERERLREVTGIVGETDEMLEVLERVVQIAPVQSTVLVTGESGTGKELVARGIHALSPRRHKPFIAVNVAALSSTLLESELFGHEKGAFTGAVDSRRGLFELADKGSIFLDEIGEMPLSTQTKLLRVIEEREFHRVGGEVPIRVDVRIIAATNQDLRRRVAVGEFRRDLYYRLNVLNIRLPALRHRREDIPLLIRSFVEETAERHDRPGVEISPEAMDILVSHDWPGNVRELRNLVESMVVLAPGREIRPEDIPPEVRGPTSGAHLVPVTHAVTDVEGEGLPSNLRPQLEFVFRTLVDLRIDVDDLRKEFEAYRDEVGAGEVRLLSRARRGEIRVPEREEATARVVDVQGEAREEEGGSQAPSEERATGLAVGGQDAAPRDGAQQPDDVLVVRPGMTMEDIEEGAIALALREVDGNRRKAAEMLGIGERTLYRKIKLYGLEEEGS